MGKQPLRRFNEEGTRLFASAITDLQNDVGSIPSKVTPLLNDPNLTEVLVEDDLVEVRGYETRFELAVHIDEIVSRIKGRGVLENRADTGLWDWLAAAYFEVIVGRGKDGSRKVRTSDAYLAVTYTENYLRYYRHMIAGAWTMLKVHENNPELAEFLLSSKPHIHSELFEHLATTNELITNTNFLLAVRSLFWDEKKAALKRGVAGKEGGSARRVPAIFNQLKMTFDFNSMPVDSVLELLPAEFDRFRP